MASIHVWLLLVHGVTLVKENSLVVRASCRRHLAQVHMIVLGLTSKEISSMLVRIGKLAVAILIEI